MAAKQELITTLSELTADYAQLISERGKADSLYFREDVPQPDRLKKPDNSSFYISDCEKIVARNYRLDGEDLSKGKATADCVGLTYDKTIKQEIAKPIKREPVKPLPPEYKKGFTRPILTICSAVTLLLVIIFAVMCGCGVAAAVFLLVGSITATLILCVFSNGGVIFLLISLACFPKSKKKREQELEKYKSDLAQYIRDEQAAQTEYDNALITYEQRVAAAEKEYADKCRELYESALSEIQTYIGICKDYFNRKKKAEAEFEKEKAEIKTRYNAIALKIKAYPDAIPQKFLNIPEFENASYYVLCETRAELQAYIEILKSGRADTIKEATNCYVADKQAEEQRRILEQQAEEQYRQAEERNCILEEQAEEQRRHNEEQRRINERHAEEQKRFNEQQAEDQRRRDEELIKINKQQADAQRELAEQQKCVATICPRCAYHGGAFCRYKPDGHGGCSRYILKK